MALVKSHHTNAMLKEAVTLDLGDVAQQARRMREQAEAEAARVVEQARVHAEQLTEGAEQKGREHGYAAGHEQGMAEGREQGRQQAKEEMRDWLGRIEQRGTELAEQWHEQRQTLEREANDAVLRFALRLAEKVVHRSIETDPTRVVDQVEAALAHVLRSTQVTVQVHPEDRPLLEEALPGLLQRLGQLEHVDLGDNAEVERGGCLVTHGQGRIDATLQTQLDRLAAALLPEPPPRQE